MALMLVLEDYADGQRTLRAGERIDSTLYPITEMVRSGLAVTPYVPSSMAEALAGFIAQRGSKPAVFSAEGDLTSLLLAAGAIGGSGGGSGIGEFVFADFGSQDESQGRYTSWTDLMAKLATLQLGASPVVRLAFTTGPFAVPLAGMPALGWDMRGGSFTSFYGATGSVVLDCAPGVMFDNLFAIGGASLGSGAVIIKIAPPPGTQVLNFSALPPGSAFIFVDGGGSGIDHSTDTGAFMKGPNAGTTMVFVSAASQQNTGILPPLTGPLLELGATDGAVGVQLMFGGLPDGWLVGGGPGSGLLNIFDLNANVNTDNIAVWAPGFTGGGGVTPFSFGKSKFVAYDDTLVAPPLGAVDVQAAIDALKAGVSPGTFPASAGLVYEPGGVQAGRVFTDMDDLIAVLVTMPIGIPVPILFSDRIVGEGSPVIVPARAGNAAYDTLGRTMVWQGSHLGVKTIVQLDDGVSFVAMPDGSLSLRRIEDDCEPHTLADSAGSNIVPFTYTRAGLAVFLVCQRGGEVPKADGDLPAIDVTAGALGIALSIGSQFGRGPGHQSVRVSVAAVAYGFALDTSTIQADVFEGAGAASLITGSAEANVSATQPAIASVTPVLSALSALVTYDDALAPPPFAPLGAATVQAAIDALKDPSKVIPSASPFPPGTWATSDPGSIDEAIQRLAAAVSGLLGVPIP